VDIEDESVCIDCGDVVEFDIGEFRVDIVGVGVGVGVVGVGVGVGGDRKRENSKISTTSEYP
jgi:hypothetical protein